MNGSILRMVLLALLLLAVPADPISGASLRGEGTFEFYLDLSTLPSRGGSAIELLQIAVPTKEIRYVEKNGSFEAQVRIRMTLIRDGDPVFDKTIRIRDARREVPRETDLSGFLYAVDSCLVEPGRYVIRAKVEDLNRKKKTLFGWVRKQYNAATIDGAQIDVSEFDPARLALGEPVLIWAVEQGRRFVPNPMQLYGLRRDTLTTYVAARLPESAAAADSLRFHVSLHNALGEVMSEETFSAPVSGGRAWFLRAYDLAAYPAGDYQLRVEAADQAGLYATASKPFAVAWELLSWQKPNRDILVEARILLIDKEYEEFQRMTIGEQEAFLTRFWKKIDPTPHTARNEAYDKFKARLRYVDAHYGTYTRGALTDRGLIFIRFGKPDHIQQQVMPKTSEDLDPAMEQLESQYKVERSTRERLDSNNRPRDTSTLRYSKLYRGPGGDDLGSIEVWVYDIKGDPILEQDRLMTVNQGLRLLFIDVDGYGDFSLRATSEDLFGHGEQ